ncbi:hypothetical protein BSZ39_01015 [Bowdeniella nasicola]|uniref:N-acetyltransferase domain-containing protein n=1 Tax=Bowdeniella nasicola TaxID=208480 RepID=A0A1Q5Q5L0_9ACTO|nr:hypothetical protein BSZ39_01015 [Bowdeniella nasicola]
MRLVRVPAGDQINLDVPLSGAWQRYYDAQRARMIEALGHADFISADAETYRKNSAQPVSSMQQDLSYVVVLADDVGAGGAGERAAGELGADDLPAESPAFVVEAPEVAEEAGNDADTSSVAAEFDALDPAHIVGLMEVVLPLASNLDQGWLDVWVDPVRRRRGLGSRLIDVGRDMILAAERTRIGAWTVGKTIEVDAPNAARPLQGPGALDCEAGATGFLLRRGFGLVMVERFSGLTKLDDPDRRAALTEHMRELADGLADHYRDEYELVHYSGATPDELVDDVAAMYTEFSADIPKGDDEEPTTFTAEKVREIDQRMLTRNLTSYTTAVRHVPSGRLVAYTTIVRRTTSVGATQEDTWVHREHRGHRLGMTIKLANLERFLAVSAEEAQQRGLPVERLVTWNAEVNSHMWAINEQLGFEVLGAEGSWSTYYRDGSWHSTRDSSSLARA